MTLVSYRKRIMRAFTRCIKRCKLGGDEEAADGSTYYYVLPANKQQLAQTLSQIPKPTFSRSNKDKRKISMPIKPVSNYYPTRLSYY